MITFQELSEIADDVVVQSCGGFTEIFGKMKDGRNLLVLLDRQGQTQDMTASQLSSESCSPYRVITADGAAQENR